MVREVLRRIRKHAGNVLLSIDYGYLLPLMASLPLWLIKPAAFFRGFWCFVFDYTWKSEAQDLRYIRAGTLKIMKHLKPANSRIVIWFYTLKRFCYESLVDTQVLLYDKPVMKTVLTRSTFENFNEILNCRRNNQGLVLCTIHLDSYTMGTVLLGMRNIYVNFCKSGIFESEKMHFRVRSFFNNSYEKMEKLMNGDVKDINQQKLFFEQVLKNGETVVLAVDVPGSKSNVSMSLAGKNFKMPLGAFHLASKTGSRLAAFICFHTGPGKFNSIFLTPVIIYPNDIQKTMLPIYRFFDFWISKYPERWLASEIFRDCPDARIN